MLITFANKAAYTRWYNVVLAIKRDSVREMMDTDPATMSAWEAHYRDLYAVHLTREERDVWARRCSIDADDVRDNYSDMFGDNVEVWRDYQFVYPNGRETFVDELGGTVIIVAESPEAALDELIRCVGVDQEDEARTCTAEAIDWYTNGPRYPARWR